MTKGQMMTTMMDRPATGQDAAPGPFVVNLPSNALRELVTVAVAAGKDDTLPTLTGVRIEVTADTVTFAATDRYRLAVVTYKRDPKQSDPFVPWSALVPAKALVAAVKALPKPARSWGRDLPDAWLTFHHRAGLSGGVTVDTVEVRGFDNAATVTGMFGEFPKYHALIPGTFDGTDVFACNPAYMADVAKLPRDGNSPVKWSFPGSHKPALCEGHGAHTTWLYLLMPVRLAG